MAADLPENYEGHPAFAFVNSIPTTWDETRILDAKVGEYILLARRSGTTWYVTGITNETGRTLVVNTDFLSSFAEYLAVSCSDSKTSHYENEPETYVIHTSELVSGNKVAYNLAPGGGFILKISRRD
jgi:alpha-glucosidase